MAAEGPPPGEAVRREPARRLFFGLWPDEAMRQSMEQATRKAAPTSGGRRVAAENLHVTLAFLGSVPEWRVPELAAVARAVARGSAGEPLQLSFDRLEYWRAAHLLCASPAESSAPTAALAGRLQVLLAERGFAPDLKPFRAHVTVVRKVSRPGRIARMHPVVWSFTEFALLESRTLPEGSVYSVVECYSLCGEPEDAQ